MAEPSCLVGHAGGGAGFADVDQPSAAQSLARFGICAGGFADAGGGGRLGAVLGAAAALVEPLTCDPTVGAAGGDDPARAGHAAAAVPVRISSFVSRPGSPILAFRSKNPGLTIDPSVSII